MSVLGSIAGSFGGAALGTAVVQVGLDTRQLTTGFAKARGEVEAGTAGIGNSAAAMAGAFKVGAAVAGVALVGLAKTAVSAASNLGESINKARVVFGEASQQIIAFSETSAEKLGIAQSAALDAAAGFGAMAQSAGLSEQASADLSQDLVVLAADMASFNNQDPSEMLDKLRAGLAGEAEPLRRFGVFISEARVKTEAYASGIAAVGSELTDAQKIQARFNLIMKDTAKQQGDFQRTVGESLPNQMRVLAAQAEDTAAAFGQVLLPIMGALLPLINDLLGPLADLAELLASVIQPTGTVEPPDPQQVAVFRQEVEDLTHAYREGTISEQEFEAEARRIAGILGTTPGNIEAVVKGYGSLGEAQRAAEIQAAQYTHAQLAAAGATNRTTGAIRVSTAAIIEQTNAYLAAIDPVFAIINAVRQDAEAERALEQARARLNRLTDQGKEGTKAYAEAKRDLSQAVLDAAQNQASLVGVVADLNAKIKAGEISRKDAVQSLKAMGREANLTKGEIRALLDQFGEGEDAGRSFAQGIEAGLRSQQAHLISVATQIAESAADAAQRALRIHSPSEVTRAIGVEFVRGLVVGMRSEKEEVVAEAEAIVDAMTRRLEKRLTEAQARLSGIQSRASAFRGSVLGGFDSFLDISGAFGTTDSEGVFTMPNASEFFGQQLAGAQQFASILEALRRQGLSRDLLSRVASAGPQAIPFAQQLLQLGPAGIAGINKQFEMIGDVSQGAARGLTQDFFGTKIDELRGDVRELARALRVLERPQRIELAFRPGGDRALQDLILSVISRAALRRSPL